MNAREWNDRYPIGTPVVAYPGIRPEDGADAERLITRTRSRAETLGGHTPVVWVDGHSACIALSHVDPITGSTARREWLLGRIRAEGGEWTAGRVKRLYARTFPTHVLRSTVRRDLAALHEAAHLVKHETPGRRSYTYDATGGGL